MRKILIIEDDLDICLELQKLLRDNNYDASYLSDFSNILDYIKNNNFDLILLDINLPFVSGDMLVSSIRKNSSCGIIMVTSDTSEIKEIISYSSGCDDYITKPYNPTILLLKISAFFNRMNKSNDIVFYKDISFDISKGIVYCGDNSVILSKNEMIIFNILLNKRECIVTREEIMTNLWNNCEYINDNALTVNISRLRSKLENIDSSIVIDTRKGLGYILL